MRVLYQRSGASDFSLADDGQWDKEGPCVIARSIKVLRARGGSEAAEILERYPWRIVNATNHFNDEFSILVCDLPLNQYEEVRKIRDGLGYLIHEVKIGGRDPFRDIATVFEEVGPFIRIIAIEIIDNESASPAARPVPSPTLMQSSSAVEIALQEAQRSIEVGQPLAGVDRIHTALHGYLVSLCRRFHVNVEGGEGSLVKLLKALIQQSPEMSPGEPRRRELERIINSLSTIVDALSTLRNNATLAHPNDSLLGEPEAILAIHATRTILHYLDSKVQTSTGGSDSTSAMR